MAKKVKKDNRLEKFSSLLFFFGIFRVFYCFFSFFFDEETVKHPV